MTRAPSPVLYDPALARVAWWRTALQAVLYPAWRALLWIEAHSNRRPRALAVGICLAVGLPVAAHATTYSGFCTCVTDSVAVYTQPSVARPQPWVALADSILRSKVQRITPNQCASCAPATADCTWGPDARHEYSKKQPWNRTGKYYVAQNQNYGACSEGTEIVVLDSTYTPTTLAQTLGTANGHAEVVVHDWVWQSKPGYENTWVVIGKAASGPPDSVYWVDIETNTVQRSWFIRDLVQLNGTDYIGGGAGEGNLSNTGRYLVLSDRDTIVLLDMDPISPAWVPGSKVHSARFKLPATSTAHPYDWVSISPMGRYIVQQFDDNFMRVFKIDTTGADPERYTISINTTGGTGAERCGSGGDTTAAGGWIHKMSKADFNMDGTDEVIVGRNDCGDQNGKGQLVSTRLSDGRVKWITYPLRAKMEYPFHTSSRSIDRWGWQYVTTDPGSSATGEQYKYEVYAISIDGNAYVQRFAHNHATSTPATCLDSDGYRCQSQAVPFWDGRRIAFASNWNLSCGGDCDLAARDYVIDARNYSPAQITDLAVDAPTQTTVGLVWSAPRGDDAPRSGTSSSITATSYEVRYSTVEITDATWSSATVASGPPTPGYIGKQESMTVTGLTAGMHYHFAVRARNLCNELGPLSNVAGVKMLPGTVEGEPADSVPGGKRRIYETSEPTP